jgi:hypothetical protein
MGMVCMAAPITGEDTSDPIGKRELCPASRGLAKKQSSFVQEAIVVLLASVDADAGLTSDRGSALQYTASSVALSPA